MRPVQILRARFAALICVALLTACAPPKQRFDRAASPGIQTVALLPCDEPTKFQSGMFSHPGDTGFFGIAGLIVSGIDRSEKTSGLTQQMMATDLSPCMELMGAVEAALQARNYHVIRTTVERAEPNKLLESYGYVDTDTDAILDLVIRSVGYVAPAAFRSYMPVVRVSARLVAGEGRHTLYSEEISYGLRELRGETVIPAERQYGVRNYEQLSGSTDLAARGIRAAITRVADWIAQQVGPATPAP